MRAQTEFDALDEYRLILLEAESRTILVEPNLGAMRLPRVAISRGSRAVRELQKSIADAWQINGIILDFVPRVAGELTTVIVEIESSAPYTGLFPTCIDDVPQEELNSECRRLAVSILSGESPLSGPFSRLGWIKNVFQWLSINVDSNLCNNATVTQYNAGSTFTLARFATRQGVSYWFKAAGHPNAHEPQLTQVLAAHFGDYLPRILAQRAIWNAWVMEDSGKPLADVAAYSAYCQTVSSLGCLQKASIDRIRTLLVSGCFDLRTRALSGQIPRLFAYLKTQCGARPPSK